MNDLAFSHPNKQLCVITCGDDKRIKVGAEVSSLFLLFNLININCFFFYKINRFGICLEECFSTLKVMRRLFTQFAPTRRRIFR